MRGNVSVRKNRTSDIKPWFEDHVSEERSDFFRRAARAQWGPKKISPQKANDGPWIWPIDLERYDRSPHLTRAETNMLTHYTEAYRFYRYGRTMDFGATLDRLVRPLNEVLDYTEIITNRRKYVLLFLLREMAERKRAFWGWSTQEWIDSIDAPQPARQHALAIAYLLCGFSDLHRLKSDHVVYSCLARKVFGTEHTKRLSEHVQILLSEWGYRRGGTRDQVMRTIFECLLSVRSPHLKDITLDHLRTVIGRRPPRTGTYCAFAISRVLAKIGAVPEPMEIARPFVVRADLPTITEGVHPEWARLCRRWLETSTVSARYRRKSYYFLLNVGRWLANKHPEINSPAEWTRDLAAEAVAVTCQLRAGDWCTSAPVHIKNQGHALKPSTYAGRISALRIFFRDLQEWELIPRRFDPIRSFVTPKSVLAKIGPNPRVIADDVWAKLVWAGLNLTAEIFRKEALST
jgi:hypothetical protein